MLPVMAPPGRGGPAQQALGSREARRENLAIGQPVSTHRLVGRFIAARVGQPDERAGKRREILNGYRFRHTMMHSALRTAQRMAASMSPSRRLRQRWPLASHAGQPRSSSA